MARFTLALSLAVLAVTVSAQSVPSPDQIPSACSSQCSVTLETSVLCTSQYTTSLDVGACFCSSLPSDLDSCASCVSTNGASDLGQSLTAASTQCPTAIKACAFSCGNVPTCSSSDVACQCANKYLQAVFDCASCNDANGNIGQTGLKDFKSLADSCVANSYTSTPTATRAMPSPTGSGSYTAPVLTGSPATATTGAAMTTTTGAAAVESGAVVAEESTTGGATGGGVVAPQTISVAKASSSAAKSSGSIRASSASGSARASASASAARASGAASERRGSVAGALGVVMLGAVAFVL